MPGRIIGTSVAKKDEDIKLVPPTILIGLGGTGKEVLLRMRQRFFEKYGIVRFPAMRYFWMDTDLQNHNIDGKPLDYLAREVQFTEDEKIDLSVPGSDYVAIFERPNTNQHIFRWMDPALRSLGSVLNGARQIRLLGRLGFFQHAYMNSNIRDRLGKARNEVLSQDVRVRMQDEYRIQVGTGLRVVIVCSIAGGTGSGIFLDTAFMVRDEFHGTNPDVVGFLLLPSVFSPDSHNAEAIYANSYAALKELEYYSMRKDMLQKELTQNQDDDNKTVSAHDFEVEWMPGRPRVIQGPPFNTCYLINNETEKGGNIGPERKTDLCDMIAENLYLDFSSQGFANKKRSVRSNLDDYLTNEMEFEYKDERNTTVHTELFSFRFSTFGMSKIYVPVDRIRKACAFKLGTELLGDMMKHNPVEGDPSQEIRVRVLPQLQLRVGQGVDDVRNALWIADDQGQNFVAMIENNWQVNERAALQQKMAARQPGLAADFERRVVAYGDRLAMPREREKWGPIVKRLYNTNKPRFIEASRERILTTVRQWMNSPYHRANVALEYLRELNRVLKEHGEYFQRSADKADKAGREAFRRLQQYQQILVDEEQGSWFHRWSITELVELLCRAAAEHFIHRTMTMVYKVAKDGCEELREFIGEQSVREGKPGQEAEVVRRGLMQQIWLVQEDLVAMHREVEASLRSFEHADPHLIFRNLYEPGLFKQYYQLQRGDQKVEVDADELKHLEEQLRARWEVASVYDLGDRKQQIGLEKIRAELTGFCMEQFQNLKLDVDAVHTLYEKYQNNPSGLTEAINLFARNGRVWIRKNPLARTVGEITQNYMEELELGISQKNSRHSNYQDFSSKVESTLQADSHKGPFNSKLDVEPDAVYLYNEFAGIPIMYIDRIAEYREAYSKHIVKHKRTPHIDRNSDKFHDALIKSEGEVRETIRINTALLVGAILRVVEINVKGGEAEDGGRRQPAEVTYRYQDRDYFPPTPVPLGNQFVAVETLRHDKALLTRIERDIDKIRRHLEGDVQARLKFFTTLSYHTIGDEFEAEYDYIKPGPFPPKFVKIGSAHVLKLEPEHRALAREVRDEKDKLKIMLRCEDADIQNRFVKMYKEIDSFTDKRLVDGKTLRILQKNIVELKGNP